MPDTREDTQPKYRMTRNGDADGPDFKYYAIAGLVLLFIVGLYFLSPRPLHTGRIEFSCRNPHDTVPGTFIFDYDVSVFPQDSVYLDLGLQQMTRLPQSEHTLQAYFSRPDVYTARVLYKGKSYKTYQVQAKSRGWVGLLEKQHGQTYVEYARATKQLGVLSVGEMGQTGEVLKLGGQTAYLRNIRNYKAVADCLTFETRIRLFRSKDPNSCSKLRLTLITFAGNHEVDFLDSTCSQGKSDKAVEGQMISHQLAEGKWHTVHLTTRNSELTLTLDGKLVQQMKYRKSLGRLRGLQYKMFNSNAEVDYVRLQNAKGRLVYEDDF